MPNEKLFSKIKAKQLDIPVTKEGLQVDIAFDENGISLGMFFLP